MTGGDIIAVEFPGVFQHLAPFYISITGNAGVGSPSAAVLRYKIINNPLLKRLGKIENIMRYIKLCANQAGIINQVDPAAPPLCGGNSQPGIIKKFH